MRFAASAEFRKPAAYPLRRVWKSGFSRVEGRTDAAGSSFKELEGKLKELRQTPAQNALKNGENGSAASPPKEGEPWPKRSGEG